MSFLSKGSSWLILAGLLLVVIGVTRGVRDLLQAANLGAQDNGSQDNFSAYYHSDSNLTRPDEMAAIYYQSWDAVYGPLQPSTDAAHPQASGSSTTDLLTQAYIPDRIVIPSIYLDAPVVPVQADNVTIDAVEYLQWLAPEKYAAGWHQTSATLGRPGNTVLNGHHNAYGEVFGRLIDIRIGDLIYLYSGDRQFEYKVINKMILREKDQPVSVRLENARWIEPTQDERVTLITCWPKDNNTHRFIVIATPVK